MIRIHMNIYSVSGQALLTIDTVRLTSLVSLKGSTTLLLDVESTGPQDGVAPFLRFVKLTSPSRRISGRTCTTAGNDDLHHPVPTVGSNILLGSLVRVAHLAFQSGEDRLSPLLGIYHVRILSNQSIEISLHSHDHGN